MLVRVSSVLVALAFIGLVAGCSKSPKAQYDAGKEAVEQARLAEAEKYAPELFKEATDSMNAATVEMQNQDGKFSAFRSYGKAEKTLIAASQIAEKAALEAAAEKERVRVADSVLIAEIDSLILQTNNAIQAAPKGKGSRIDLKVMQADIDAATVALNDAREQYLTGDYMGASERLSAVKQQVVDVKGSIESAIANLKK